MHGRKLGGPVEKLGGESPHVGLVEIPAGQKRKDEPGVLTEPAGLLLGPGGPRRRDRFRRRRATALAATAAAVVSAASPAIAGSLIRIHAAAPVANLALRMSVRP